MQMLNALASKYGFSTPQDLLGAVEVSLLDDSTTHAPTEQICDVLDVLAPRRTNRVPSTPVDKMAAVWAVGAAFQVLQ
jgi:hypothetical protein